MIAWNSFYSSVDKRSREFGEIEGIAFRDVMVELHKIAHEVLVIDIWFLETVDPSSSLKLWSWRPKATISVVLKISVYYSTGWWSITGHRNCIAKVSSPFSTYTSTTYILYFRTVSASRETSDVSDDVDLLRLNSVNLTFGPEGLNIELHIVASAVIWLHWAISPKYIRLVRWMRNFAYREKHTPHL